MALEDIGVRVLVIGLGEFRRAVGTARDDLRDLEGQVRAVSRTSAGLGTTLTRIGSGLVSAGRALTLGITTPLAILTGTLVNAGIQFEDTFAGVAKTAEGVAVGFDEIAAAAKSQLGITITTMEEAKKAAKEMGMAFGDLTPTGRAIRDEFRQLALEIPVPANELNKLGEVVGQLGVKAEDIPFVTKLVAELGVATDIAAEDAAFGLIRLGNILEGTSLDIVDFTNRAGSALVALGNASVSTEGEILQVALRLAAAGERAGFSEAQIFAWATTITDLGARAEAGGTAVSRALNEMILAVQTGSENLGTFAQVSGLSMEAFVRLFQKDASKALDTFIKKLEEGIKTGRVTKDMLTDLGLGGVRAIDIIGRLGEAEGILNRNLDTANKAWAEAIALQEEAEKRFQTVKSQIQLLRNAFTDLGITIFDLIKDDIKVFIENIREVIQWFKALDNKTKKTILVIAGIAAAIGPLMIIGGSLISALGSLVTLFGALLSPVGLVTAAIALLATTLGSIIGWENIFAAVRPVLDDIKSQILDILDLVGLTATITPTAPTAQTARPMTAGREAAKEQAGRGTVPVSANVAEEMQRQRDEAARTAETWAQFSAAVQTAVVVAQDAAKAFVDTIVQLVGPQIQETVGVLTQTLADFGLDWQDVWEALKTGIAVTAQIIGAILLALVGVVVGIITGIATGVHMLAEVWRLLSKDLSVIVEGIVRTFAGLLAFFDNVFKGNWIAVGLAINEMMRGTQQMIEGTVNYIVHAVLGAVSILLAVLGGFVAGVITFFENLYEELIGHSIVPDIIDGILQAFRDLVAAGPAIFDDFVSGIIDSANNLMTNIETILGGLGTKVADLFSGIFAGGGGEAAGAAPGGMDFAQQFLIQIQSAIPQIQAAWGELMLMLSITTTQLLTVLSDNFFSFLSGLQANFTILETSWLNLIGVLLGEIGGLSATVTIAFMAMSAAVVLFSSSTIGTFGVLSNTVMGIMNTMQAFWLVIVQQMVHHWLDFVYATLALTGEWAATTQGELMAVGNAFITTATNARAAWTTAVTSMRGDMAALGAAQNAAASGFEGVGRAAGSAARAVWIAANNMIAAMKAVLAAATGSPELKIQHPFERFEGYLKKTNFGELVDQSMGSPAINNNINTVLPASAAGSTTSIDQSINMGDVIGGPFETQDDVLETMTRIIRIGGVTRQ